MKNITDKLKFDPVTGKVEIDGVFSKLTTKESELFFLLLQHVNDLLPREKALEQVWGDSNYFNARSMDVYITKLRQKLSPLVNIQIINVHGKGYRLSIPADELIYIREKDVKSTIDSEIVRHWVSADPNKEICQSAMMKLGELAVQINSKTFCVVAEPTLIEDKTYRIKMTVDIERIE